MRSSYDFLAAAARAGSRDAERTNAGCCCVRSRCHPHASERPWFSRERERQTERERGREREREREREKRTSWDTCDDVPRATAPCPVPTCSRVHPDRHHPAQVVKLPWTLVSSFLAVFFFLPLQLRARRRDRKREREREGERGGERERERERERACACVRACA